MRAPSDMSSRRRRGSARGRIALIVGLVALFLLITSLRGIAGFWTDYLWFDALDLSGVFTGILGAQVMLAVAFTAVFFVLLLANLWIADRVAPTFRPQGPEEELLVRYHDVVGRRAGLVRAGIALLFALMFGVGAAAQWNEWVLFTNSQDFGVDDPLFGEDVGFYVFRLPFLLYVVDWLFVSLIIILIVTAIAHYLNGGIRVQSPLQRVTPQVKVHLSVLLAGLSLVKAVDYWLQRYELVFSTRGVIDGAGYTEVNAQLPALNLLLLISLAATLLFIVNIWLKGWVWPVTAVALWAFAALIVGTAYPSFVQRFQVEPEESAKESQYIADNIDATRQAYGLDDVEETTFDYDETITAGDLAENEPTIRNIRLLDPDVVDETYNRVQAERGFYRFPDLDIDRYRFEGPDGEEEVSQVVLGTRELNVGEVPRQSWEGQHAAYTHGYGLALAPTSRPTPAGRPDFIVGDVPIQVDEDFGGPAAVEVPQLYHGEGMSGYAVVDTEREEIDYVGDDGEEVPASYQGDGGVGVSGTGVGGLVRRAAFALRFGEIEPLISNFVKAESRVIYVRDVRERVEKAAPFVHFDADPYPVVADGRVHYMIDGYVTSDRFPYSQRADTGGIPGDSGLDHTFNYVRNSVKAVVDAYDGDVTLYVIDPDEPITQAYQEAFPALFAPLDEMPDELREHWRYPDDLFIVQTTMWGRYHLSEPDAFYNQTDGWQIAEDPGTDVPDNQGQAAPPTTAGEDEEEAQISPENRIPPYYLQMTLPDEDEASFISLRPFVPVSAGDQQKILKAFMVAKSDPGEDYGKLKLYEPDQTVDGPALVNQRINQEEEISSTITQLNQQGSRARFGNLLLIPIEDSLLYVRPLYVQADEENSAPQLTNVILSVGENVVLADDLPSALAELFQNEAGRVLDEEAVAELERIFGQVEIEPPADQEPEDVPAPEDGEPPEDGDEDDGDDEEQLTIEELLAEADALFAEADEALADGDLATYQERIDEARAKVQEALGLGAGTGGTSRGGDSGDQGSGEGDDADQAGSGGDSGDGDGAGAAETTTTTDPASI